MASSFSRSLPSRPDLGQQRKLAKELLGAFTAGDPEARARIREVLPDKPGIALADAQFVLAREYGFTSWAALKQHIEVPSPKSPSPEELIHEAFKRSDADAARRIFKANPHLQRLINEPVFDFDSPALVAFSGNMNMLDVLLEFGADPNRRSNWWAGGFHPLHTATGAVADRLIAAGAVPDACAAANLDRPELLARLLAEDSRRVHERGGDGQTPLHFARSQEVVDMLLDAGADIDARDIDHRATAAEWMLDR